MCYSTKKYYFNNKLVEISNKYTSKIVKSSKNEYRYKKPISTKTKYNKNNNKHYKVIRALKRSK